MTSKALSTKKTAWNLFGISIKKNFGITILVTVFMLLICPGYTVVEINRSLVYSPGIYDFSDILPALCGVISFLTCGVAVIYCFINFAFMYSKKSGDMYFALPLTRNKLLFSRLFASMAPVMLPIVLCYGSAAVILLSDKVSGGFSNILIAALLNILLVIMSCFVTMLFIVCAGSVTDLLISFFGLNIGAIVVAFMVFELCDENLRGFYCEEYGNFMTAFSPFLYGFINLMNKAENGFILDLSLLIYILRIIATSAICIITATVLFRKRKAEKCTAAYAYRGMYYVCGLVVSFLAAFMFGLIFGGGNQGLFFWVFGAFGAVLGAITFGLITDRGFKTVKKSLLVGICSFVIMVTLTIILKTGAFGYTNRIPKAENIKSVTVSFDSVNTEFENPQLVTTLHKKAIESDYDDVVEIEDAVIMYGTEDIKTESYENEGSSTYIKFNYNLKNGLKLKREFLVSTKDCSEELLAIYKSKENIEAMKNIVDMFINPVNFYSDIISEEEYMSMQITKAETKKLIDAYIEDLRYADERIIHKSDEVCSIYLDGTKMNQEYDSIDLFVTDDFENTKNVIEKLDPIEKNDTE